MSDSIDTSIDWMKEAGKAALTGAGGATIFGIVGALYYSGAPSTRYACRKELFGPREDVTISFPLSGFSDSSFGGGCVKVLDLPVVGRVDSTAAAAGKLGVAVAVVAFLIAFGCFIWLSVQRHRQEQVELGMSSPHPVEPAPAVPMPETPPKVEPGPAWPHLSESNTAAAKTPAGDTSGPQTAAAKTPGQQLSGPTAPEEETPDWQQDWPTDIPGRSPGGLWLPPGYRSDPHAGGPDRPGQ
jgi:hypothetical protein